MEKPGILARSIIILSRLVVASKNPRPGMARTGVRSASRQPCGFRPATQEAWEYSGISSNCRYW